MAALDKSIYEDIVITSPNGNTVDIAPGTVMVDYYEDLFSPVITAKIQVVNEGHSITGEDGELESIFNGLPLRGGEKVSLKIAGNCESNPGLDFTEERQFYVSSVSNVLVSKKTESFTLHLISREAISNETSRVGRKYPPTFKLSESVKDIVKNYIGTSKEVFCDPTQNTYGFLGNMRKPFTILFWLASKSVPESDKATAGYVFYETQSGFNFKSIDGLIDQEPVAEYVFSEVIASEPANDFKILKYTTNHGDDILGKLQRGAYCSHRIFFNPLTFNYTDPAKGRFEMKDYEGSTLGSEEVTPTTGIEDSPSRFITAVMDVGTLEKTSERYKKENAEPSQYQSQSMMRYNSVFSKEISMTIPSNTNLQAGNLIECSFVRTSDTDTIDEEQSGLYMIAAVCHHFDPLGSFTQLNIIKDTFGPKAK